MDYEYWKNGVFLLYAIHKIKLKKIIALEVITSINVSDTSWYFATNIIFMQLPGETKILKHWLFLKRVSTAMPIFLRGYGYEPHNFMSDDWRALQSIIRIFQNTNGALKVIKLLGKLAFGKPAGDWYTWVCARERRAIIYAWLTSVYLLQICPSIVRSAGFRQRSEHGHPARRDVSARMFKQTAGSPTSLTRIHTSHFEIVHARVATISSLDTFNKLTILRCNI